MNLSRLLGSASLLVSLTCALPAAAQSIDYGSLEQIFNEPVTTSATGSPQRETDVPADMTIITAEDIKRSGATDLPTIISRVAGIDILNSSSTSSEIGVRGYDQGYSSRLLVLVNGRQVYLDHYGYTAWSTLPVELSEIRQIEVVRGPAGAVFGFNAVGGVVNIITFNPKYDTRNTLELHGGTGDNVGGSAVGTFHLTDRLSARLSAGGERRDEWSTTGSAISPVGMLKPWSERANLDVIAQLAAKTELRLEGSWSVAHQNDISPSGLYTAARYRTASVKATLASDTSLGLVQATAYVNRLRHESGVIAANTSSVFDNAIKVVSLQDLFKVGADHTFRLAVEYRDNAMPTQSGSGGRVAYSNLAPGVMWNWQATPKLAFNAAGRLDHLKLRRTGPFPVGIPRADNRLFDQHFTQVSGNLGAVFKATDADTFRITYARGVQAPALLELGAIELILPQFGLAVIGNPYERPSIVTNYEVAYNRDLPELKAEMAVKLFRQRTTNVKGQTEFALPPTATTFLAYSTANVGDSKMWGAEVSAKGRLGGGFHWSADASYTKVSDQPFAGVDPVGVATAFAETTPRYRGNAALGWSDARWAADAYLQVIGPFKAYDNSDLRVVTLEAVPGHASLAGRIAYQLSEGTVISLNGQNLLTDRQVQVETSGLRAERRVFVSISKDW